MNTKRPLGILLILTMAVGILLSGCQALPPVTLSHAVDRADDLMRSSGRSLKRYDVPNAYFRVEENGWLVIYRTRQGYARQQVYIFVPTDGPARFSPDLPRPQTDNGYYNHP